MNSSSVMTKLQADFARMSTASLQMLSAQVTGTLEQQMIKEELARRTPQAVLAGAKKREAHPENYNDTTVTP